MILSKLKFYYERVLVSDPAELFYRARWMAKMQTLYRVRSLCAFNPAAKRHCISLSKKRRRCIDDRQTLKMIRHGSRPETCLKLLFLNNSKEEIIRIADDVLKHRIKVLELGYINLGKKINWLKSPDTGNIWEKRFFLDMYHHRPSFGNITYLWHINRFSHLIYLGAAYHLTGARRYADEAVSQIDSWIRQNPYLKGPNWIQAMELALRMMSWLHALAYIHDRLDKRSIGPIALTVQRHTAFIEDNLSLYNSANNHLISELLGLLWAHHFFPGLRFRQNREKTLSHLESEIEKQIFPDGAGAEQSTSYHLMNVEMILISKAVLGLKLGKKSLLRIRNALHFLDSMTTEDYFSEIGDYTEIQALSYRSDESKQRFVKRLGKQVLSSLKASGKGPAISSLKSRGNRAGTIFKYGGYSILIDGRVKIIANHSNLGYLAAKAHGHCDVCGFEMFVNGEPLLVDCGSQLGLSACRPYLKSERAHNTFTVGGNHFSESRSHFIWGKGYEGRLVTSTGHFVTMRHDAYGFHVMRKITLLKGGKGVEIKDSIGRDGIIEQYFNLYPGFTAKKGKEKGAVLIKRGRKLAAKIGSSGNAEIFCGARDPLRGWYSHSGSAPEPVYHICIRTRAKTARATLRILN